MSAAAVASIPNGVNGHTSTAPSGAKRPKGRAAAKRAKQKQKKAADREMSVDTVAESVTSTAVETESEADERMDTDDVEYVPEQLPDITDPSALEAFSNVFARFQLPPDESSSSKRGFADGKGEVIYSDEEQDSDADSESGDAPKQLSKRKQRKAARLSVAELKQLVKKPEVVEWTDVSATDPRLLLHLKSSRNSVPVPAHWSAKRDYLQGKRGIEKAPFQLPAFIADTGIATMRDAVKEKEAGMSLKAKTRERVQPKMGKVDIDYQKLHDAFFKYQTKPPMTGFGEMYYEGKEFETTLKEKRPGDLSAELVEALSIPPLAPPPWLIAMQRFGPPPSYPTLRIPGLNAPIPEGAQWGFHPGGWGKPPLDEYNRPLYGDVFGVLPKSNDNESGEPIDSTLWGEPDPEEEEEESSEEESSEEEEDDETTAPTDGMQTPAPSGLETPSGMHSVVSTVPGGLETPDFLELRKEREPSSTPLPRSLYQVVPERTTSVRGLMGSERGYDISAVAGNAASVPVLGEERGSKRKGGVEVSLDSAELDGISTEQLRAKFDAASRGNAGVAGSGEDYSDMIAKEMARKKQKMDKDRANKAKEKEYKF